MARLGLASGGRNETFPAWRGSATSSSRAGRTTAEIAGRADAGRFPEDAAAEIDREGDDGAVSWRPRRGAVGVEMPITNAVCEILEGGASTS
jgi:hypothetical protein